MKILEAVELCESDLQCGGFTFKVHYRSETVIYCSSGHDHNSPEPSNFHYDCKSHLINQKIF